MKQADIRNNSTYTDSIKGPAEHRKVTGISRINGKRVITYIIMHRPWAYGPYRCSIKDFAAWAKREVEE